MLKKFPPKRWISYRNAYLSKRPNAKGCDSQRVIQYKNHAMTDLNINAQFFISLLLK